MPQIGTSPRKQDSFFGNIGTLTLDAKLFILPAGSACRIAKVYAGSAKRIRAE